MLAVGRSLWLSACTGDVANARLILGLHPANERRRYKVSNAISHWLGTNLESALLTRQ